MLTGLGSGNRLEIRTFPERGGGLYEILTGLGSGCRLKIRSFPERGGGLQMILFIRLVFIQIVKIEKYAYRHRPYVIINTAPSRFGLRGLRDVC